MFDPVISHDGTRLVGKSIQAAYATNDRAFYIYLDEATDGYTMENNWCPTERFDSNRPGKKNVWKNNGPQVADSIKYKAGRIKQD